MIDDQKNESGNLLDSEVVNQEEEGSNDTTESDNNAENSKQEQNEPIDTANSFNNPEEGNFQSSHKAEDQVETESENDSIGLIDSPLSLQRKLERINNEIIQKDKEHKYLTKKVEDTIKLLGTVIDPESKQSLKERKLEYERERNSVTKFLEELEHKYTSIQAQLNQHESVKRKSLNNQTESIEIIEKVENISPQSLFLEDSPLENTILYAATFFPNLNSYDFEKVVSFLLEGQTTIIKVKSQVTTEQGEFQNIEEPQKKSLVEIWKNSFIYPDKFLSNCYISSVTLEDDSHVIDFVSPQLREKFEKYFQQKQPFYLLEQFKRAKYLIFDQEVKVAIGAMSLSVNMAVSSPNIYGKEWLFEIIKRWVKKVENQSDTKSISFEEEFICKLLAEIKIEQRKWFVYGRISSLIAQMLDHPKLRSVINSFFNQLIAVKDHATCLEIAKRLFYHPQFDGFYWIKQLLDRGDDERIKPKTYKFLCGQLNQNADNIYDFLEISKSWLPEHGLQPDRLSPSNRYALQLLPEYCDRSIKELDLKQYGKFPPQYSLFTPLLISDSINNFDSTKEKLDILFTWLLHPEITSAVKKLLNNNNSTSKKIINSSHYYLMSELLDSQGVSVVQSFVPLILTEWCVILWGLDKKEPEQEVLVFINCFIQQLIYNTKNTHQEHLQKRLIEYWNLLIGSLLEKAESYRKSNNRQLRKQYLRRRNIVKYLKKQFKTLKKQAI